MRILLPKHMRTDADVRSKFPLFFLGGPVLGGGDWQSKATQLFGEQVDDCIVACPRRWTNDHELSGYFINNLKKEYFKRQLHWEEVYMEYAALESDAPGCIAFYLALENENDPHPGPEPYAMDTRRELGIWMATMRFRKKARVVVGAEEGFFGLSQIQRAFSRRVGYEFPIHKTLEDTVDAAVQMMNN